MKAQENNNAVIPLIYSNYLKESVQKMASHYYHIFANHISFMINTQPSVQNFNDTVALKSW